MVSPVKHRIAIEELDILPECGELCRPPGSRERGPEIVSESEKSIFLLSTYLLEKTSLGKININIIPI